MMEDVGEIYFSLGNIWLLFVTMLHVKTLKDSQSMEEYSLCVFFLILVYFLGDLVIMRIITLFQTLNYGLSELRQELCFLALLIGKPIPLSIEMYYEGQ